MPFAFVKSRSRPAGQLKRIGSLGEDLATESYQQLGCSLLERNWRAGRYGEIDLILRAPDGAVLFVEVKTRKAASRKGFDHPGTEAINRKKQQKIVTSARIYLAMQQMLNCPYRFEVVLVYYHLGRCDADRVSFSSFTIARLTDCFVL